MPDGSIAPVVATERNLVEIAHSEIHPSPTNPRKLPTDPAARAAAVADITATLEIVDGEPVNDRGVRRPLRVRRRPDGGFEIVSGERRHVAAGLAGLRRLLCEIVVMSDVDALAEQLGDADAHLSPLEEASGFARLREQRLDVAEIAARCGKSARLVRRRLALLTLCDEARAALAAGRLSLAGAEDLATVSDPAAQLRALKDTHVGEGERIDRRDLVWPIRRTRMRLGDASFDRADASLPGGACGACPKRTGAQRALWAELDEPDDVCTDEPCFEAKTAEHTERIKARATERGIKIVEGDAAKKLFPWGPRLAPDAGVVDLALPCDVVKKPKGADATWKPPTWGEALALATPPTTSDEPAPPPVAPTTIAIDPEGRARELVSAKAARKALEKLEKVGAIDLKSEVREPSKTPPKKPEPPPVNVEELARAAALAAICEGATKEKATPAFWAFLAGLVIRDADARGCVLGDVLKRRGIESGYRDEGEKMLAHLGELDEAGARGVIVELLAAADETDKADDVFDLACRRYKINVKALEDAERAKLAAPRAEAEKPAVKSKAPPVSATERFVSRSKPSKAKEPAAPAPAPRTPTCPSSPPEAPKGGTCRVCGCQDDTPCGGPDEAGCVWANTAETLCTWCAEIMQAITEHVEDAKKPPTRDTALAAVEELSAIDDVAPRFHKALNALIAEGAIVEEKKKLRLPASDEPAKAEAPCPIDERIVTRLARSLDIEPHPGACSPRGVWGCSRRLLTRITDAHPVAVARVALVDAERDAGSDCVDIALALLVERDEARRQQAAKPAKGWAFGLAALEELTVLARKIIGLASAGRTADAIRAGCKDFPVSEVDKTIEDLVGAKRLAWGGSKLHTVAPADSAKPAKGKRL